MARLQAYVSKSASKLTIHRCSYSSCGALVGTGFGAWAVEHNVGGVVLLRPADVGGDPTDAVDIDARANKGRERHVLGNCW